MKSEVYTYAVARIRANEVKFLSKNEIENLIASKNLTDAISLLRSKGWVNNENSDCAIKKIISKQSTDLWDLLCESVPDKNELEIFTVQNDFYNIKVALKCLFSEKDASNYFVYPTSLDLKNLISAFSNLEFSMLGEMYEQTVKEAYYSANKTQSGQTADIILDKAALNFMYERANKSDCSLVGEIYSFLCDTTNIKIAYRCAVSQKPLSFIREALSKSDYLDMKTLAEKASEGVAELSDYLSSGKYKEGSELLKTDAVLFEKWCDNELIELTEKAKFVFFGFEPICAYFFAKQNEIKTVRMILTAKESGLSEEIIRERVRASYV